ncbi:MAG TPA: leucine-rich repeat protein [Opitutales bacterium]|jgi:hypothetical protein|nr:leucine-rich repeat protein [Opitutales bacterium]
MRAIIFFVPRHLIFLMAFAFAILSSQVQAQFNYTTNNGNITITGYTGPNGAVTIPSTILVNGVNLPVTSIGAGAFESHVSLISVTIPNSVTTIGNFAFAACFELSSVSIGNGVTSIGANAFEDCDWLTSVTISSNVTNIGEGAFTGCSGLIVINVDPSNPNYSSIGGALFDHSQTTLIAYPGVGTSYTIPNGVTNIEAYAFFDCPHLTSVVFPNSVTTIGSEAFANTGLTSVTIPASVTSIGEYAFQDLSDGTFPTNPSLTSVYFMGNAPSADSTVFDSDSNATVYYLTGTVGWSSTFVGLPTMLMSKPSISTPPASALVVSGANASFNVAASVNPVPITYQWQVSTDGGNTWNNVSGSTYSGAITPTLTITNAATTQLGFQYQAVLTNYAGSITTTPVPLVVGTSTAKLSWLQNNFTSTQLGNPNIVADSVAPAGDGIPNLLKYAFNLQPFVNEQSSLPQPTASGGNLTLTFPTPQSDLTYTVEASPDLINWSTTGVMVQTNGTQETASYPISPSTSTFLHVVVAPSP